MDLFDVSTSTLAQRGHGVDEEDKGADNGHGSGGAHQVQSLGVGRPVVSWLGLGPVTENGGSARHKQNRADEVEQGRDLPWNAKKGKEFNQLDSHKMNKS